jgi:hypothetical protein
MGLMWWAVTGAIHAMAVAATRVTDNFIVSLLFD